jgi:sigma-B regulation protein RsbU (phosphoserine phosphatase)
MPPAIPTLPESYEIATKYQPASHEADVCGDFCDIFDLGEGKIGISVGDIVGKGLIAAIRVTGAKNMIRNYAYLYDQPSKVMSLVNDALCRDIAMENDMLTAFFAVLDTHDNSLTYSNAGHEPPMLHHTDGSTEPLKSGGPMFCGIGKQTYIQGCINLTVGDIFVAVTDGITEASIDKRSEQFAAEGIINSLLTIADDPAEHIAAVILDEATKFANGALSDDATIVVIKHN